MSHLPSAKLASFLELGEIFRELKVNNWYFRTVTKQCWQRRIEGEKKFGSRHRIDGRKFRRIWQLDRMQGVNNDATLWRRRRRLFATTRVNINATLWWRHRWCRRLGVGLTGDRDVVGVFNFGRLLADFDAVSRLILLALYFGGSVDNFWLWLFSRLRNRRRRRRWRRSVSEFFLRFSAVAIGSLPIPARVVSTSNRLGNVGDLAFDFGQLAQDLKPGFDPVLDFRTLIRRWRSGTTRATLK